ncbi:Ribonuclease 3 [Candidatus Cyrtobacter comes]|uniref:Ribonuclease 3 n=1 Tax=Candidatus Cyrtobacter comes TaxID=675776 RepID=A0ABU5L888_9RICK|nr:ribonuclease III [Candidatus Cyrtobacter comes]MDZ5762341.1 Ribonuclease 3 [Candidatus Cyrtobacter comes]
MKISYNFKDSNLLKQALTHPSHKSCNKNPSYERLEFLGDKILGAIIAKYIYIKFQHSPEGHLSLMHSNLVSSEAINKVANKVSIGEFIIMDKGEENSGGRKNANNIENVMEALIGAVFLDGGYQESEKFVLDLWEGTFSRDDMMHKNPKSLLQEIVQKSGKSIPTYEVTKKSGPSHESIFEVCVTAQDIGSAHADGNSIKEAECNAALKLIEKLNLK